MSEDKKLNEKQKAFCRQYIIDFNGTRSAIEAGYSKKTARNMASENLAKPNIQKFISELIGKRAEKTQVTAERVVEELAKIGLADTSNGLDGWETLDLKDKLKALEMLARHTGAFNNDESGKTVLKVKIGE